MEFRVPENGNNEQAWEITFLKCNHQLFLDVYIFRSKWKQRTQMGNRSLKLYLQIVFILFLHSMEQMETTNKNEKSQFKLGVPKYCLFVFVTFSGASGNNERPWGIKF